MKARDKLGENKTKLEYFQSFIIEGGMPFLANQSFSYKDRVSYLKDIYNSIILKDIIEKEKIRDVQVLKSLMNFIFANPARTFSANSVRKYLKNEGINASINTILNYLVYAKVPMQLFL